MFTIALMAVTVQPVAATTPYTTWTLGPGGFFVPVQDAYTPLDQIDLPVNLPEDMFFAPDGFLYVADTGNGRILKLNQSFEVVGEYGADVLEAPTGLYVHADGTMFIADSGSDTIVILDHDGAMINQFGRPDEPLFGANREFLPRKIAVDARGNLYIVSEGSIDGLVMMTAQGEFIGYFGANDADMSLRMILQRLFLTEEQLESFIRNEAASPTNLAIDSQSLVYTITSGTQPNQSIRKFTVSGRNLIDEVWGTRSFRDLHVSDEGLMIGVDGDGELYEYDTNGVLLFTFGGIDRGDQRLGLLSDPTAIERIGEMIVVLDRGKNALITYSVTDFARRLHEGVRLYMNGFYEEARPFFEEVLTYNGLVVWAYQAIADANFNEEDFRGALEYYRYAEDRAGYSEAFWELRNEVLQRYLASALGVFVVGWVGLSVFNRFERRRHWLDPVRRWLGSLRQYRLIDDFVFMFRFIRQPADSYYYIKVNQRGSLTFALLIYVWIILVRVLSMYLTGFVFNPYSAAWQIHFETEVTYTLIAFVVWNAANYLIASISNGEGSLRHIIIGTAYSLFPYVLFAFPITLLSNLLTLNEVFLFNFSMQIILVWSGIMLIIMVKEIHNFTVSETVRNLLATLFTMAIFLLTAYILYVLFNQLYEFILAIIQEVGLRG